MPRYVDGFVIPIATKNLAAYKKLARTAGKVWREHGALQYVECVGEELSTKQIGDPFPKMTNLRKGETIVFSWIVYKSKADRNRITAMVMKDPRLAAMMDPAKMPFDLKRMAMGGFLAMVDLDGAAKPKPRSK